jgi:alpha-tubulin suppressor-like RCC1 family protein
LSGVGLGGALAVMASVVAVACGSGGSEGPAPRAEAPAASESAALTGTSCQAMDIAGALTTDTGSDGSGTTFYAVDPSGNVLGWGFNGAFKAGTTYKGGNPLGFDNLQLSQPTPVKLGITKASKIAAHWQGACAITNPTGGPAGSVVCVGQPLGASPSHPLEGTPGGPNASIATIEASTDYVHTTALSGAVGITAGFQHACVWTAQGAVWCWGADNKGQLGDGANAIGGEVGSAVTFAVPMLRTNGAPINDALQVAAAGNTTCVLHKTGKIDCVGANGAGELGLGGGATNGAVTGLLTPINVASSMTFASLSGGNGTPSTGGTFCATTAAPDGGTGTATLCWGNNANAQADINDTKAVTAPVHISTAAGSTWSPGPEDACEVTTAGALKCWGVNGDGSMLPGAPTGTPVFGEQPIGAVANVLKVAVGYKSMCALGTQALWCWGSNAYGELGQGNTANVTAVSNLYIGQPAFTPPSNSCGTITDACNVQHNVGTCPSSLTCSNNKCVPYAGCGTNGDPSFPVTSAGANPPLTTTATVTGVQTTLQGGYGFLSGTLGPVYSAGGYGSSGCDGFIWEVNHGTMVGANAPTCGDWMMVQPSQQWSSTKISTTDCPNTRVTIMTYDMQGNLLYKNGPVYGSVVNGQCVVEAYAPDPLWQSYPPNYAAYNTFRVVGLAEQGSAYKNTLVWSNIPVGFDLGQKWCQ